jgi:hypothetical protein
LRTSQDTRDALYQRPRCGYPAWSLDLRICWEESDSEFGGEGAGKVVLYCTCVPCRYHPDIFTLNVRWFDDLSRRKDATATRSGSTLSNCGRAILVAPLAQEPPSTLIVWAASGAYDVKHTCHRSFFAIRFLHYYLPLRCSLIVSALINGHVLAFGA